MPLIRVSMWPRPIEVKRELAKAITDAVVRVAKAPPEATWIIFEDIPQEHWAQGGNLASD